QHNIERACPDSGQEPLQRRTVERGAGKCPVVIPPWDRPPAFVPLALYVCLTGLALGVERGEGKVEVMLARLAGVDGAARERCLPARRGKMLHDGVAVRRPCINAVGEKLDMGRSSCKTSDVEDYRVRHQCFGCQHPFFIFDEYQDFNPAEKNLLEQIINRANATLIAGDDDQVLYDTLKSGKASLIRAIYRDTDVVNAMLPFCARCDFHITSAASHFIKQAPDLDSIKKIYLPISEAGESHKVQVVACAAPSAAVDYVRKFIEDHKIEIDKRKADLAAGAAKDAYLLILFPSRTADFYRK